LNRIGVENIASTKHPYDLERTPLIGVRVYEREDYEAAIKLNTAYELPFEAMITKVEPLTNDQQVFET
jgi:hypothetical protein